MKTTGEGRSYDGGARRSGAAGFIDLGTRVAASAMKAAPAIDSDRTFNFPLPRQALWSALSGVDNYPGWWPWLREFDARSLTTGDVWTCTVQPPVPYLLHFSLRLDEVVPGRLVRATIDGDIRGTARLELRDRRLGTEVRLVSSLAPHHPVLRAVLRVARPVAQHGHDWVLETGARQFALRVARQAFTAAAARRA